MPEEPGVVLVSNRGPITFIETDDGFDTSRGAGGLAAGIDAVARMLGDRATWITATTSDADRRAAHAGIPEKLRDELGYHLRLVEIDPETYRRYYDVVCNRMLWFANHCLWDELNVRTFGEDEVSAWDEAYEPVNKLFADAAAEATEEASLVLLQDYHLYTAAKHLRARRPDETIGHFTHSSFCGVSGLDRLPRPIPTAVIEGMLANDLLGFHVKPWVDGFLECAEQIGAAVDHEQGRVRWQDRDVWMRAYPIPVDARDLRERAGTGPVREWARRFRSHDGPLLVRADRAEPSKNIVRGFEAFGMVLDRRDDLAASAKFVACLYPSRETMPEYREYTSRIREAARTVNDRHPDSVELFLEDDFDRTVGALVVYDALLVNPLMDGMNLVSKEGPVVNENDGVLILSRRAGSFHQLGKHAVPIDEPTDVAETSKAIEVALDAPHEERKAASSALREIAETGLPEAWIQAQIDDLGEISRGHGPLTPPAS